MSNRDPETRYGKSLSQALEFFFSQKIKEFHTAIPGVVNAYEQTTKRARVQIGLNMRLTDGKSKARPIILDVPVCHPSGGGYVVHVPLRAGDGVLLVFSERGIENFKETFAVADPPVGSIMAERDAIAVPGIRRSLDHACDRWTHCADRRRREFRLGETESHSDRDSRECPKLMQAEASRRLQAAMRASLQAEISMSLPQAMSQFRVQ